MTLPLSTPDPGSNQLLIRLRVAKEGMYGFEITINCHDNQS